MRKFARSHAKKSGNFSRLKNKGTAFRGVLLVLLVLLTFLLSCTGLNHGLIDPDEGRYSEIPREMLESGDYITPRLNYVKYFEKPVLHYWLTALAFKMFGQNEAAARATPVIAGFIGVALVFLIARNMTKSTRVGFFSASILASSLLWYIMSHMNLTDMSLTLFFTVAMTGYYFWFKAGNTPRDVRDDRNNRKANKGKSRTLWILVFYSGMALATLTKGLIGVVLPGGIALLHMIIMSFQNEKDWQFEPTKFHKRAKIKDSRGANLDAQVVLKSTGNKAKIKNREAIIKRDSAAVRTSYNFNESEELEPIATHILRSFTSRLSATRKFRKEKDSEPQITRRPGKLIIGKTGAIKAKSGRLREIMQLFSPWGIALFFAITVPWFWAVCRANPDFFQFFFIHEHFLRYATKVHDRYEPMYFFIPVLLGALVPWTGLLLDALHMTRGRWGVLNRGNGLLLGLWAAVPFVFFSLSGSKLVPYILPCLPPLAILMGAALEVMMDENSKWGVRRFFILSSLILVPVMIAGIVYPKMHPDEIPASMTLPLSMVLLVFWMMTLGLFWKRRVIASLLCLLAFTVPFSCSGAFSYFAALHSQRELAAMIKERIRDGDEIVVWRDLLQGLAFYMNRRIITAGTLNELEFGANALVEEGNISEREQWFKDSRALQRLWNGPNRVFLVTRQKYVNDLRKEVGREIVRLGENLDEVLCANF